MTDKHCSSQSNPPKKRAAATTQYVFKSDTGNISCEIQDQQTSIKIKIYGTPRPMYRVQAVCKKTNKFNVFTPSKRNKISFANAVQQAIQSISPSNPFHPDMQLPVSIVAHFYFKRPSNHFNMNGLLQSAPYYCTKTPDIDNLLKLVMDALHNIVYTNDCVVCELTGRKFWLYKDPHHIWKDNLENEECTIIKITEYQNNSINTL
jgi:Holliday junction resolvase RusA-like endonuclease